MSGVKLTIILPTKHRISVKVSSKEALIRQVLEDACVKKSLDPDAHQLRRNNKVMQCANNIPGISDYNKKCSPIKYSPALYPSSCYSMIIGAR